MEVSKMILTRALFAGLLILVAGLNCLTETPASAQTDPPIQLTEVKLAGYRLSGQSDFTPLAEGEAVKASALELQFTAKVNRQEGRLVRLKVGLHEACFLASTKRFTSRFNWIGNDDVTTNPTRVGLNGVVSVITKAHCFGCPKARCGKHCPDRDHLGEGPHMASLTVADNGAPVALTNSTAGLFSPTYRVDFASKCDDASLRAPKQSNKRTKSKKN
jgi:hypothetical protein